MSGFPEMQAVLGGMLGTAPPVMTGAEAAALAVQHFGVEGRVRPLTSERDLNFHIATGGQGYVLKLANPAEPAAVTEFQTKALLHLEGSGLPVPRVVRTLSGATEAVLPQGVLRLLTYLEGEPQHLTPRTAAQRAALARMAARLTRALAGFQHPAADHVLQWDIKQAGGLRGLLAAIPADLQGLAQAAQDRFDDEIAPALPGLRWQVVHNDLNPHNVLTLPGRPDEIAGVLDFGDMVRTPLVCDAAIAASYLIDPAAAFDSVIGFARAYHAELPLLPEEARLFPDLIATRMLTTLAVAFARAQRYPENAAYILRNTASARAGLVALAQVDRPALLSTLETI